MAEPNPRELRHRAAEANRLMNEPLLLEALEKIRLETLLALEDVDATDAPKVMKLQAKARMTRDIVMEMQAVIMAAPPDEQEPPA